LSIAYLVEYIYAVHAILSSCRISPLTVLIALILGSGR
jgi:hypothetical protein